MGNRQSKKAQELADACAKLEREGSEQFVMNSLASTSPAHTKTLQLCKQVEQCLSGSFACFEEEELQKISIYGVQSAGGSSNLLVLLLHEDGSEADHELCFELIEEYYSDLRGEVASVISRRRCPELSFRFVN